MPIFMICLKRLMIMHCVYCRTSHSDCLPEEKALEASSSLQQC